MVETVKTTMNRFLHGKKGMKKTTVGDAWRYEQFDVKNTTNMSYKDLRKVQKDKEYELMVREINDELKKQENIKLEGGAIFTGVDLFHLVVIKYEHVLGSKPKATRSHRLHTIYGDDNKNEEYFELAVELYDEMMMKIKSQALPVSKNKVRAEYELKWLNAIKDNPSIHSEDKDRFVGVTAPIDVYLREAITTAKTRFDSLTKVEDITVRMTEIETKLNNMMLDDGTFPVNKKSYKKLIKKYHELNIQLRSMTVTYKTKPGAPKEERKQHPVIMKERQRFKDEKRRILVNFAVTVHGFPENNLANLSYGDIISQISESVGTEPTQIAAHVDDIYKNKLVSDADEAGISGGDKMTIKKLEDELISIYTGMNTWKALTSETVRSDFEDIIKQAFIIYYMFDNKPEISKIIDTFRTADQFKQIMYLMDSVSDMEDGIKKANNDILMRLEDDEGFAEFFSSVPDDVEPILVKYYPGFKSLISQAVRASEELNEYQTKIADLAKTATTVAKKKENNKIISGYKSQMRQLKARSRTIGSNMLAYAKIVVYAIEVGDDGDEVFGEEVYTMVDGKIQTKFFPDEDEHDIDDMMMDLFGSSDEDEDEDEFDDVFDEFDDDEAIEKNARRREKEKAKEEEEKEKKEMAKKVDAMITQGQFYGKDVDYIYDRYGRLILKDSTPTGYNVVMVPRAVRDEHGEVVYDDGEIVTEEIAQLLPVHEAKKSKLLAIPSEDVDTAAFQHLMMNDAEEVDMDELETIMNEKQHFSPPFQVDKVYFGGVTQLLPGIHTSRTIASILVNELGQTDTTDLDLMCVTLIVINDVRDEDIESFFAIHDDDMIEQISKMTKMSAEEIMEYGEINWEDIALYSQTVREQFGNDMIFVEETDWSELFVFHHGKSLGWPIQTTDDNKDEVLSYILDVTEGAWIDDEDTAFMINWITS